MRCAFCQTNEQMEPDIPFCETCWQTLEKGATPPMDFQDYFSEDLELKLKQTDTLLFSMPSNHFLWYLKGHLEHELGDTKKALRSLNSSLNYNERFGDPWIRLGLVYSDLQREDEAVDSYETGLTHPLSDPTNLIDAGIPLLASGNPRLASRLLVKALDLVPQDDRALVAYGKSLVQLGELDEARKVFERSLELYPHNEEVLRGMAQMMLKLEDLDNANEMYSRILDQHTTDFEALLAMGEINLKRGELTQALKYYKEVSGLEVSISWPGIIRFILSTLKGRISRNENQEGYREDLRKEYENMLKYIRDLDSRAPASQGPETLKELEGLIRVIEGQRITVKEQMVQFDAFLNKYEKGDPFRTHLEERMGNLSALLQDGRYFDAKQVALELSPLVSELKQSDQRSLSRLRDSLKKRMKDLEEVGLGSEPLQANLEEAEGLEEQGTLDRALFLYKELETSLEEHWQVSGKRYYESKMKEMRDLLDRSRDQFDVTGLTRLYESFGNLFRKGPLSIRDSYLEFLKRYEESSTTFYQKEGERLLKEVQYKLVIMEKEGADVSTIKTSIKVTRDGLTDGTPMVKFFTGATKLLEQATELELKHKVKGIKDRMRALDLLKGQMELLGLDSELARNIDPVRSVIERSISAENYKLAEVLTNEVMENVENALRNNYLDQFRTSLEETVLEVEKLGTIIGQDRGWRESLASVRAIMDEPRSGRSMLEAVTELARVQSEIQGFYTERLPAEIDRKLERCKGLLNEGGNYGIDLREQSEALRRLSVNAKKISSFELLEEASKFELELGRKVEKELGSMNMRNIHELKERLEALITKGLPQVETMGAIASINRAEVLMEDGDARDSYRTIKDAQRTVDSLQDNFLRATLEKRVGHLKELVSGATMLGMEVTSLDGDISDLTRETKDPRSAIERTESLLKRVAIQISDHVRKKGDGLRSALREVARTSPGAMTDEEVRSVEREIDGITFIGDGSDLKGLSAVMERVSATVKGMEERSRVRRLLDRCTAAMESIPEMDDAKVRELRSRTREILATLRKGDRTVTEGTVEKLEGEVASLNYILDAQGAQTVLNELSGLDDLSKEVFRSMEGDEFSKEKEGISAFIADLLQRTTALYGGPDPKLIREMTDAISQVRESIINLENRWRAKKRLMTLESVGAMEQASGDPELMRDINDAKESYQRGDFGRFFRTWEHLEARLSKPQVRRIKKESELEDKAMQVLIRGRQGPKRTDLEEPEKGKARSFGGIKRLARDIGEKRKLMESGAEERMDAQPNLRPNVAEERPAVTSDEALPVAEELAIGPAPNIKIVITPSIEREEGPAPLTGPAEETRAVTVPPAPDQQERDISGIARLIAGSRIEQLRREGSEKAGRSPIEQEAIPPMAAVEHTRAVDAAAESYKCMMDEFLDLESPPRSRTMDREAHEIKRKLECFFERLPGNLRIEEAVAFYSKGIELMERGDGSGAIREFRLAISSAIKIGKLHADLSKALRTVRVTIDNQTSIGPEFLKVEKLYLKAEDALGQGSLEECARNIKAIRNLLAAKIG